MTFFSHSRPWGSSSGSPTRSSNFSPESKVIQTVLFRHCSGYGPSQHGGQVPKQEAPRRVLFENVRLISACLQIARHDLHKVSSLLHDPSDLVRLLSLRLKNAKALSRPCQSSLSSPSKPVHILSAQIRTRLVSSPTSLELSSQALQEHHRSKHPMTNTTLNV